MTDDTLAEVRAARQTLLAQSTNAHGMHHCGFDHELTNSCFDEAGQHDGFWRGLRLPALFDSAGRFRMRGPGRIVR